MASTERLQWQSAFALFLRTGLRFRHQDGADVEVKFNPWHDPDDGRFTFRDQGRYFGGGGNAGGGGRFGARTRPRVRGGAVDPDRFAPRNPRNHTIHTAQPGDSLTSIAAKRHGLRVADLAWLNGLPADARLAIGQSLMVPRQSYLDEGRDALGVFRGLSRYMDTHGGHLPPGAGRLADQLAAKRMSVSRNGYAFRLDGLSRSRDIQGVLASDIGERSRRNQREAGGPDRRANDDGGHYIARRFHGPSDAFNHFAQDSNFNRGAYRAIEDKLAAYQKAGKHVHIHIVPRYHGISQRPYEIDVAWGIDGNWTNKVFDNEKGGNGDR